MEWFTLSLSGIFFSPKNSTCVSSLGRWILLPLFRREACLKPYPHHKLSLNYPDQWCHLFQWALTNITSVYTIKHHTFLSTLLQNANNWFYSQGKWLSGICVWCWLSRKQEAQGAHFALMDYCRRLPRWLLINYLSANGDIGDAGSVYWMKDLLEKEMAIQSSIHA